ncbi:ABC transporter [Cordyceps militaris]|uniref:ABC transporter n=1 Tax=Cordyceps militaris TaxID=73501 RepID=A0A2H4SI38_CORMI|nr:ABC transporter [Cordyceps militaris]
MFSQADHWFWPVALPIFDFSLKFEETILQLLPSCSFLLFASATFLYYWNTKARIRRSRLLWTKLGVSLVLVALELTSLVLRSLSSNGTETTSSAASLDFVAALAIAGVVYVEHGHAIRTSALLGLYLGIGILIDVIKSRSYFLRSLASSGAVAAATATARLVLVIVEEVPKTTLIIDPELRTMSDGEATCGFYSRICFLFLRPMMRLGYRGILVIDDLSDLGIEFASRCLFAELSDSWPTSQRVSRHALCTACFKAWKWSIFLIFAPRLFVSGFMYSQPFVMRSVISDIGKPDEGQKGGLVAAVLFAFSGPAICRAASTQLKNRLVTRVRGGLFSHIFDKSYRLEAAITLMSADFESIAEGIPACIEVPFAILESCLGVYFLAHFVKLSCLVVFAPLLFTHIIGVIFGNASSSAVAFWNEKIEMRVTRTSQILSQLPAIKSLGLGPQMAQFIQHLRVLETAASTKYRCIQAASLSAAVLIDQFTPVLVVAVGIFAHVLGDRLDPEIVYPTLGVLTLVQGPLADLLTMYPEAMSMLGCFDRIQQFLCQNEHKDPRVVSRKCNETHQEKPSSPGLQSKSEKFALQTSFAVVCFEQAKIAPRGSEEVVLSDVDFSIDAGSITSMFGPTCSGKTTLFESMLGEANILEGKIFVDETVVAMAFCGQDVYLPNGTVRACIVGTCEYEPTWFNTVVTCCRLSEDLGRLPNGENYIIGSGGIALSGGQRQRIGIARAVYARARVVLLDDVFSAIDRKTALAILFGLCGENGLLRQLNCTVVVSSYLAECLDVADNLLLLAGNGSASFEPRECKGKLEAQVACLLHQGLLEPKEGSPDQEARGADQAEHPAATSAIGVQRMDESRQKGDKDLYILWIDSVGRLAMTLFTLLMILVAASDAFPSIYIRVWIDIAPGNKKYLIGYALIAASAGLLAGTCLVTMFTKLAPRASNGLHEKLTSAVTQSTLEFLSTTDSGDLLNRFSEDMELLSKRVPTQLYSTLYSSLGVLAHVGAVLAGTTYMVSILPVVAFFLFFIQRYYLCTSRQLRLLQIEAQAPLVTSLRDIGTGLAYIRGFRSEEQELARCLYLLDRSQKPYYALLSSQAFLYMVVELVVALMAVVLTILALYVTDSTSPNAAGLAFLNLINLGTGFNMVVNAWTAMETAVGSLSRLRNFLRNTPTEQRGKAADLPENWPSRGEVLFDNVTARYKLDYKTEQAAVLQGIHLQIDSGKKIGIVGRSGSGKSSLLLSLLGFLEYEGKITIDDVDVKTAHPDQLRARVITISQDLVELDGTIRDNMLPYDKCWAGTKPVNPGAEQQREAERKDHIVRETLVRLGIWERLPAKGGLDAILDKVGYSHGEKQLLCIARAVVRRRLTNSRLVLVDEATASVDSWREQIVREMMLEYFRDCTIIVVAHREETVADSNRTVHMAGGKIEHVDDWDNWRG